MLTVRLIRAKGLKASDSNGKSDPFCKVSMPKAAIFESDAGSEGEERIRYKSKVMPKTLEPEWNETFEFVGVREDATLAVECYDRDKGYVTNSKQTLGSFDVVVARDVLAGAKSGMVATETEKEFALRGDPPRQGHRHPAPLVAALRGVKPPRFVPVIQFQTQRRPLGFRARRAIARRRYSS